MPLSLQLWIKVLAIAQRRAPASDPANNEFFLVMVTGLMAVPADLTDELVDAAMKLLA